MTLKECVGVARIGRLACMWGAGDFLISTFTA